MFFKKNNDGDISRPFDCLVHMVTVFPVVKYKKVYQLT